MQYCPKCRISIRGDKTECPLCGGRVTGNAEPGGFPVLDRRRFSHMSLVKVGTFCLLTFIIIMNSLEILYGAYCLGGSDGRHLLSEQPDQNIVY